MTNNPTNAALAWAHSYAAEHQPHGTDSDADIAHLIVGQARALEELREERMLDGCDACQDEADEKLRVLTSALRNQGLLQRTATGVVWHVHDCPASFDFAECNYRCRVAREAFEHAGVAPYEARPCACRPGDLCTCAYDCDCRERDAHIWTTALGWRNIEGEQETRRDTEVYE